VNMTGLLISIGVLACFFLGRGVLRRLRRRWRIAEIRRAKMLFSRRREWLEAHFLKLAGQSGLPRGLAWSNCDFDDGVAFARDRKKGQLRALVGVTIGFEALEGGGMEEVEAVGNLRAGTAVFYFLRGQWQTDGRAIFNLNPVETIQHYESELELVP